MSTTQRAPEPPPVEVLIPSLPNDVALNILARVPRQYHPILSAVSKPIRAAISSPHFFTIRSLLNYTESLLYLRVRSTCHLHENWFAVHRNPNAIINNSNNLLRFAPVPRIPIETPIKDSAFAAMGPKIYFIGGRVYKNSDAANKEGFEPSSDVWILDCRSHTWERGPSFPSPRWLSEAVAVDGKVFVVGGHTLSVDVLDLGSGRWEAIPIPFPRPLGGENFFIYGLKLIDGNISFNLDGVVCRLDPTTQIWEFVENVEPRTSYINHCVVDGVSYRRSPIQRWEDIFEWFDERIAVWKELKGVMEGKPKYTTRSTLFSLKGRLVMMFGKVRRGNTTDLKRGKIGIWCAEIEVTKNADGDWCGQTHWPEKVLLLPEICCGITEENFYSVFPLLPHSCNCLSVSL